MHRRIDVEIHHQRVALLHNGGILRERPGQRHPFSGAARAIGGDENACAFAATFLAVMQRSALRDEGFLIDFSAVGRLPHHLARHSREPLGRGGSAAACPKQPTSPKCSRSLDNPAPEARHKLARPVRAGEKNKERPSAGGATRWVSFATTQILRALRPFLRVLCVNLPRLRHHRAKEKCLSPPKRSRP